MEEKLKIVRDYNLPHLYEEAITIFKSQNAIAHAIGVSCGAMTFVKKGQWHNFKASKLLKICIGLQTEIAKRKGNYSEFSDEQVVFNFIRLAKEATYDDFLAYYKSIKKHFTMDSFIHSS